MTASLKSPACVGVGVWITTGIAHSPEDSTESKQHPSCSLACCYHFRAVAFNVADNVIVKVDIDRYIWRLV